MFFCPDDLNVLENFVYGDTPAAGAVESLVREVFANAADFDVSEYELSSAHDIRFTVVRTLMTYMELLGHLERGTPFYATYQFKPLKTSAEILGTFRGRTPNVSGRPVPPGTAGKDLVPSRRGRGQPDDRAPRDRVVRALDYLAEQQYLELKVAGVRHRFKILRRPDDTAALSRSLYDRALQRERREIARLGQVVGAGSSTTAARWRPWAPISAIRCASRAAIARGAGKADGPAGCRRGPSRGSTRSKWSRALDVRRQNGEVLGDARSLARFLCGLLAPAGPRQAAKSPPVRDLDSRAVSDRIGAGDRDAGPE